MRNINILATQRVSTADRAKIQAADPAVKLIDAGAAATSTPSKRR